MLAATPRDSAAQPVANEGIAQARSSPGARQLARGEQPQQAIRRAGVRLRARAAGTPPAPLEGTASPVPRARAAARHTRRTPRARGWRALDPQPKCSTRDRRGPGVATTASLDPASGRDAKPEGRKHAFGELPPGLGRRQPIRRASSSRSCRCPAPSMIVRFASRRTVSSIGPYRPQRRTAVVRTEAVRPRSLARPASGCS